MDAEVVAALISAQMFDESSTLSHLLQASFHNRRNIHGNTNQVLSDASENFDFLAGRAYTALAALCLEQALKFSDPQTSLSSSKKPYVSLPHNPSAMKYLVRNLVRAFQDREVVLKRHANLLLEKKNADVGVALGQSAALYYTQAVEMNQALNAILQTIQNSNNDEKDSKTLKGFVRYLSGLYRFRAQFYKRCANDLFKSENDNVGTIMCLHAALIVQQSKELVSLADTGKSERLSTIGARGSESNQKYLPSILEELVNKSHPFQETFKEKEPYSPGDDKTPPVSNFSYDSQEYEYENPPINKGKQENMVSEEDDDIRKARVSVVGFLYQLAGAYKEEANALTLKLSNLNSNKDQNVVEGYKVLLRTVSYQSDLLLKQVDESSSSIDTLVSVMLFLSASYNDMQIAFTETANKHHTGSMQHILIEDAEMLEQQGIDFKSKSTNLNNIQELSKLLIGFYKERATNFRVMTRKKKIKKDSAAVFMLKQHAEILDKCTISLKI